MSRLVYVFMFILALVKGIKLQCSVTKLCPNNLCCSRWGFCGSSTDYCGAGCQSGACNNGGDTFSISQTEFINAVTSNSYPPPTTQQYNGFISQLKNGAISTKREAAMFLAHVIWETGGLQFLRELACVQTGCPGQYSTSIGYPGQNYYGRGYLQLSWDYNYKAASSALFGDDRLLRNPDQVASNENIAWSTAYWYWKNNVGIIPAVKNGYFGASTKAINGAIECTGSPIGTSQAQKRFAIYKNVLKAFNINEAPIESGCYN